MTAPTVFVGIDVAQATLAVAMHPGGASWTVPNDATGLATLQWQFQRQGPALIVLEATGGLERLAASTQHARYRGAARGRRSIRARCGPAPRPPAGWPRRMRSMPRCWAHFAAAIQPAPRPRPDAQTAAVARGPGPAAPTAQDAHGRAESFGPDHQPAGAPADPGPRALA